VKIVIYLWKTAIVDEHHLDRWKPAQVVEESEHKNTIAFWLHDYSEQI